ncbi:hypothetical protein D3C72_2067020 [compost metagenome]
MNDPAPMPAFLQLGVVAQDVRGVGHDASRHPGRLQGFHEGRGIPGSRAARQHPINVAARLPAAQGMPVFRLCQLWRIAQRAAQCQPLVVGGGGYGNPAVLSR